MFDVWSSRVEAWISRSGVDANGAITWELQRNWDVLGYLVKGLQLGAASTKGGVSAWSRCLVGGDGLSGCDGECGEGCVGSVLVRVSIWVPANRKPHRGSWFSAAISLCLTSWGGACRREVVFG
ncbi:hypothetical protein Tco_0078170 [Tanacetum coccineum]